MNKKVLVIGATGLIGQAIANQLKDDGYSVRVLSRNLGKAKGIFTEGFELFEGDVLQNDSLNDAFHGVQCVYVNLPEKDIPFAMKNIIEQAKVAGVEHIAHTSGCTVREENAWHPMIKAHLAGEQLVMKSGLPYSIFRLTMVMDMLPKYAHEGRPFIIGNQPHGWSWIYSGDLAKMVSKAFSNEKSRNKKFTIFGPDKVTIPEAVDRFNAEFYPEAKKAKPMPYWMANILALFIGKNFRFVISLFKYFATHPEEGDPTEAYKLLGKPEIGIEKFIALYKTKISSK